MADHSLQNAVVLLHTQKNLNFRQIADELNIRPAQVGKLIEEAWESRIIDYILSLKTSETLEARLVVELARTRVWEPNARVVPIKESNETPNNDLALRAVGSVAARYLEGLLQAGMKRIAIDGGKSVSYTIEAMKKVFRRVRIDPVAEGPPVDARTSVHGLMGRFIGKYGDDAQLTVGHLSSTESKSSIDAALHEIRKADVFLLGIGGVHDGRKFSSTFGSLIENLRIEGNQLLENRVAGVIGYQAFDSTGESVHTVLDERVLKISGEDIKAAAKGPSRRVMIVGTGRDKVGAFVGAIRGGWANCVVTDETTAMEILQNLGKEETVRSKDSSR